MYSLYKDPSGEINLDLTAVTQGMTKEDSKVCTPAAGDVNHKSPPVTTDTSVSCVLAPYVIAEVRTSGGAVLHTQTL